MPSVMTMCSTIVESEYFTDNADCLVDAFRDEYHLRFNVLNTDHRCYKKATVHVVLSKREHWCFIECLFAHKNDGALDGAWMVDVSSGACVSKRRESIPDAILSAVSDARCFVKGDDDGV
mgnify:CR=1 FL=1